MSEPFHFDRATCERFLKAVATGDPIDGKLTHDEMLILAGVMLFMARSHGPFKHRLAREGAIAFDPARVPMEHREAESATFLQESLASIGFFAHLAEMVNDGQYGQQFPPHLPGMMSEAEPE
jgi:hypothetical protein